MTRDLHADEPDWNIRTEHEAMFTGMGIPTKALIAVMQPADEEQVARAAEARVAAEKNLGRAMHDEG